MKYRIKLINCFGSDKYLMEFPKVNGDNPDDSTLEEDAKVYSTPGEVMVACAILLQFHPHYDFAVERV